MTNLQNSSFLRNSMVAATLQFLLLSGTAIFQVTGQSTSSATPCFNSTQAITFAILADPRPPEALKEYVICPNTIIPMGYPADAEFSNFLGGDWPIVLNGDNIVLKCGDDGSSANQCVFVDGFAHIIVQQDLSQFGVSSTSAHNLTIQGLTFTGTLANLPIPGGGGAELESAVLGVAAPGTGMVVEDCHWKDLTVNDIFYLAENFISVPGTLPKNSIDLTFRDCSFQNVNYTDETGMSVFGQTVALEKSRFESVYYTGAGPKASSEIPDIVAGLACVDGATCTVVDSCFDDLLVYTSFFYVDETSTPPSVLTISDSCSLNPDPGITVIDDSTSTSSSRVVCDAGLYVADGSVEDPCREAFSSTIAAAEACAAVTTTTTTTEPGESPSSDSGGGEASSSARNAVFCYCLTVVAMSFLVVI